MIFVYFQSNKTSQFGDFPNSTFVNPWAPVLTWKHHQSRWPSICKLAPGKVCQFDGIAHKYTYDRSNCPPRLGQPSIYLFWAKNDPDRSAKIFNYIHGESYVKVLTSGKGRGWWPAEPMSCPANLGRHCTGFLLWFQNYVTGFLTAVYVW